MLVEKENAVLPYKMAAKVENLALFECLLGVVVDRLLCSFRSIDGVVEGI